MNQRTYAYLIVDDPRKTLDFAKEVFEATENYVWEDEGHIRHAQFEVEGTMVMMGKASEDYPAVPSMMYVYVDDVDATFEKAKRACRKVEMEPVDQEYG